MVAEERMLVQKPPAPGWPAAAPIRAPAASVAAITEPSWSAISQRRSLVHAPSYHTSGSSMPGPCT
jgi:hypothetical protein